MNGEFLDILEGLGDLLNAFGQLFSGADGFVSGIVGIVTAITALGGAIAAFLAMLVGLIGAIGTAGTAGVGLIVLIAGGLLTLASVLAVYIFSCLPYYMLGKKADVKFSWLAWVPIPALSFCFHLYILSMIPGEKPVTLLGQKLKAPNRFLTFWVYIGLYFLGNLVVQILIALLDALLLSIPGVNAIYVLIAPFIHLAPLVALVWLEISFLYDTLCMFKENKKTNLIVAIILTLIDNLFTLNLPVAGLATTVYLYTLLRNDLLVEQPGDKIAHVDYSENLNFQTSEAGTESLSSTNIPL